MCRYVENRKVSRFKIKIDFSKKSIILAKNRYLKNRLLINRFLHLMSHPHPLHLLPESNQER